MMPSFQVVSNTDLMEVDNAINNVLREIKNRFDLNSIIILMKYNKNLILIGYMAAGKSSIGRLLAKKLNFQLENLNI